MNNDITEKKPKDLSEEENKKTPTTSKDQAKKKSNKKPKTKENTGDEISEDSSIDAPSIDSLLYDGDDGVIIDNSANDKAGFEAFIADYKSIVGKSLSMAKKALNKKDDDIGELTDENGEGEQSKEKDEENSPSATEDIENTEEKSDEKLDDTIQEASEESNSYSEVHQISMELDESEIASTDEAIVENVGYNPEKPRFIDSVFDFVELFIFTLAAVLFLTTFFFKHTIVDGGSMMNTLHDSEHLIISDLFYTPERGDIIVFADYSAGQKKPYVKRVIGIAGDKVCVDATGNVTVNDIPLEEDDYVLVDGTFPQGYYGKECIVPEGEVFVLGDHRNASSDSATFPHTTIKVESILGKVLLRIYPFEKFGIVE